MTQCCKTQPHLPVSCRQIKGSNQENTGAVLIHPGRKSFIAVLSNPGQQCSIFLTGSLVVSNGFKGQTSWAPTPLSWWNNSVSKCSLTPVREIKVKYLGLTLDLLTSTLFFSWVLLIGVGERAGKVCDLHIVRVHTLNQSCLHSASPQTIRLY